MPWEDLEAERELQEELDAGGLLAEQLVEHLLSMGAARATIPVWVDGCQYRVSVEKYRKPQGMGEA